MHGFRTIFIQFLLSGRMRLYLYNHQEFGVHIWSAVRYNRDRSVGIIFFITDQNLLSRQTSFGSEIAFLGSEIDFLNLK